MATKEKIKAHRNGQTREFDKTVWDQLPADKYGWKKATEEPAEVSELKSSEGASSTGEAPKLNAGELATKILAAKTAEEVDSLVPDGETRKTVLSAAETRKAQLAAE